MVAPVVLGVLLDIAALGESVLAAAIVGLLITTVFSLGLLGVTRADDSRREGRGWAAIAYGVLGAFGLLTFGGAIVYVLWLMIAG